MSDKNVTVVQLMQTYERGRADLLKEVVAELRELNASHPSVGSDGHVVNVRSADYIENKFREAGNE